MLRDVIECVVAASEIRHAEKGYDTIRRFLPEMESTNRRNEIEATLPRLQEVVDALSEDPRVKAFRAKAGLPEWRLRQR